MKRAVAFVFVLAVAASGCGGQASRHAERVTPTQPTQLVTPIPRTGFTVARSAADLTVFDAASAAASTRVIAGHTAFGSPRALLVDRDEGAWLHVLLPTRPNGGSGWIRRSDVELREIDTEVHVDLAARRLTVTQGGREVLSTAVAVGSPKVPTPVGHFFVVDELDTGNVASAYGPYAFGLSAHSDVLTEFGGGDGQVAIHGTNDPASIGHDVSHGCIRVPNDIAVRLAGLLSLGTPVEIA